MAATESTNSTDRSEPSEDRSSYNFENHVDPISSENEKGSLKYLYIATFFATLGSFLFGYDTAIVSGAMLSIKDAYGLETLWVEVIVTGTIAAAAVFALVAGVLADIMGRKKLIMLASVIFTAAAVVMAAANGKYMLLIGRIIAGIAIGFVSMVVPIYVAELSPPEIRGRLVTTHQLLITTGIVCSSVAAGLFSSLEESGWRYMLGISGVPAVIQFIAFFWLPESPRWLIAKGRENDARAVLEKARNSKNIEKELNDIRQTVDDSNKEKEAGRGILRRMFTEQPLRRAVLLGCGLLFFQQFSGINTVIYYSGSTLLLAGFPSHQAIWLICVPNGINFLFTFIGLWLVDRLGRRILTLSSILGIVISLLVLGLGFQLSSIYTPPANVTEVLPGMSDDPCMQYTECESCISDKMCGFCYEKDDPKTSGSCLLAHSDNPASYANHTYYRCNQTNVDAGVYKWTNGYCPTDFTWMAILGQALFVMSFAPGFGPMAWTINSEIYPLWARSTANSMATATCWACNVIVSLTFLTLTEKMTSYGTFYMYGGISIVGFIFIFLLLPETKHKVLEEVEELFMSPRYKKKIQTSKNIAETKTRL